MKKKDKETQHAHLRLEPVDQKLYCFEAAIESSHKAWGTALVVLHVHLIQCQP